MNNDDIKALHHLLKSHFDSTIFFRGRYYFRDGLVSNMDVDAPDDDGTVTIFAQVSGTRMYDVCIYFNQYTQEFEDFSCTCPYGERDYCKHEVAVGLAFLETCHVDDDVHEDDLPAIDGLSSIEHLSERELEIMIARLNDIRERRACTTTKKSPPKKNTTQKKHRAPDIRDYYIVISIYNACRVSLHKKDGYDQASAKPLLKQSDLTDAQRIVLEWACEDAGLRYYDDKPVRDYMHFFSTLDTSGFSVFCSRRSSSTKLHIDLNPAPLPARLTRDIAYNAYYDYTTHTFQFSLPSISHPSFEVTLWVNDTHIVLWEGNQVRIYASTPILSQVVRCIEPREERDEKTYRWNARNKKVSTIFVTTLLPNDVIHLNDIITDASACLGLDTELSPDFGIIEYADVPQQKLVIDYSQKDETFTMRAVLDYGCMQQDVAESVLPPYTNAPQFRMRQNWFHPGEYIVVYQDTTIQWARKQPALEIGLYKIFYDDPQSGFTKTLKCSRTGQRIIFDFLQNNWAYVKQQCDARGIDIEYLRDRCDIETVDFRANVSADLDTVTDWLAFDIACYCGPDQITIEDLRRFIIDKETFLRSEDGRLLSVTNRAELERFVYMLESFEQKEEQRFEGRVYHAPELAYVCTESPYYTAQFEKGFNAFLREAKRGKPIGSVRLSKRFKELLRPYQREGVSWLYFLRKYRFAGILADDMGLGKTIQTLVLLSRENIKGKPSIIICPKTLLYNWYSEAAKFTPELNVAVVDGIPKERRAMIDTASEYDVLITGYHSMQKDFETYETAGIIFNYCVLDEAQFIKNHRTKNAHIVKKVHADYRLALTGTPLENSVSEIWSVFDFLMPGFLGSHVAFARRFEKPIMDEGDAQALADLRQKVQYFMLRRTKEEVLPELPAKVVNMSHCHLEKAQNVLYQQVLSKIRKDLFETVQTKGFEKSRIHILAGLTKLRQICNHPALVLSDKKYTAYPSAKLDMFNELVEEIIGNQRKVLVFSQFTHMLDILAAELGRQKISYVTLSGKTRHRDKVVEEFNTNPDISVFLISLRAGGTGLNLTSADNVIVFDPWWNPSVEHQAVDRAHRIGQKRSVNVFRLVTVGTIEEKILALQDKKTQLFSGVVGESRDMFKKLTWDDIKRLFE